MSNISQFNFDGKLMKLRDSRFENDNYKQYNLNPISSTVDDATQNSALQSIYNTIKAGGSCMVVYDKSIILSVKEVDNEKMVLATSSDLTYLCVRVVIKNGVVQNARSEEMTPILYGDTDYEDGVTPLRTGTIYCYYAASHNFTVNMTPLNDDWYFDGDLGAYTNYTSEDWPDELAEVAPFFTRDWLDSVDDTYTVEGDLIDDQGRFESTHIVGVYDPSASNEHYRVFKDPSKGEFIFTDSYGDFFVFRATKYN